ncbi:MAG TPA: response regulator/pilus assembly protein [Chloroflexi bacterium]|nr:response regulator/pilus assembly protein [Chloroflexota bacterium]
MAHILIVDDDRDILRLMEFSLKRAGYEVTVASNGPQGLEIVSTITPDLIIADIMMPEMTGYEFTRRLREMPGMESLPLIIYSARFQPIDKQTALDAGATEYMPKTLTPTEIVSQVKKLLGEDTPAAQEQLGATFAFFSLRGGVGLSSLAVNVAVALAYSQKTPVCLTDLNPFAGHAGLMLGLQPKTHLQTVLSSPSPVSGPVLREHLGDHVSGVQLLASPLLPSPTSAAQNQVEAVITALRSEFKFSILDLPHIPDSATLEILAKVTKLVLVLSPDMPSLQSAVAGAQLLTQAGITAEQIAPVLNHNSPASGLSKEIIQKTIRLPLAAEIPFEAGMMAAINSGKTLVLHNPKSPTSLAIARLAVTLVKQEQ